ncbi:MAG TPA: hypothetical protein VHW44_26350 [Pseudonocardiaceae bacterium]|jgi:hypothetical protein|nr:hypothetical protein [Pseudonocardiaceae bacterium]
MTEPGFAETMSRFGADLDGAVVRARRVAAEARATSAKFRAETRQLADKVRAAAVRPQPGDLTDPRLRGAAAGFRTDHGLAVERLPEGRELLAPHPPQPATPSAVRVTPAGRRMPPPGDDDEDFSQERIMR